MHRKRHLSGCKDEREVACRRKAVEAAAPSADMPPSADTDEVSMEVDDNLPCPIATPGEREGEMDCITCKLCCHCVYEPTMLSCGHTFCKCCLTDHLMMDASCPTCSFPVISLAPNVVIEEKVDDLFPCFRMLREKINTIVQKRMLLELFHLRSRLESLRTNYHAFREERLQGLKELKKCFFVFYEAHAEEQRLEREYREGVKAFDKQNKLGAIIGLHTTGRNWDGLPDSPCCLESLISEMDRALLQTPQQLISSYDTYLNNIGMDLTAPIVGKCKVCGRDVNIMPSMSREVFGPVPGLVGVTQASLPPPSGSYFA